MKLIFLNLRFCILLIGLVIIFCKCNISMNSTKHKRINNSSSIVRWDNRSLFNHAAINGLLAHNNGSATIPNSRVNLYETTRDHRDIEQARGTLPATLLANPALRKLLIYLLPILAILPLLLLLFKSKKYQPHHHQPSYHHYEPVHYHQEPMYHHHQPTYVTPSYHVQQPMYYHYQPKQVQVHYQTPAPVHYTYYQPQTQYHKASASGDNAPDGSDGYAYQLGESIHKKIGNTGAGGGGGGVSKIGRKRNVFRYAKNHELLLKNMNRRKDDEADDDDELLKNHRILNSEEIIETKNK